MNPVKKRFWLILFGFGDTEFLIRHDCIAKKIRYKAPNSSITRMTSGYTVNRLPTPKTTTRV